LGGSFFEPTVLTDVTTDMVITKEETFGPVAPLYRFKSEDDAIKMANDTEFGLASYFYSRDIGRIRRVAETLEYGIVGINERHHLDRNRPFGGMARRDRFGPQQMRQTTTGEVRLDEGNATSSSAARRATRRLAANREAVAIELCCGDASKKAKITFAARKRAMSDERAWDRVGARIAGEARLERKEKQRV
jgi:hypothetical protein